MFNWYVRRYPNIWQDSFSYLKFVNGLLRDIHQLRREPNHPTREDIENNAVRQVTEYFGAAYSEPIKEEIRKLIRAHDSRFT